ncbi:MULTISPECIES: outer membrane protein assembly factor BamB family protein [Chloracidobacterium]|jgi:outer membrane protein assembly factor BamB|uniref:PQQ enzyme repeat protein n=1 Tax=Chloracidobacterium thermophilum (strain B) TaxID=981222 RepID=G2LFX8_CHLTF|nr:MULTISPECIES: PQQ-binding-like beta-propeller repeat protein [Chloracidobacterium]AEP12091.1 PQQ enzyme repeat protein [Chloracidobacterium thermophilum B]QUV77836.1 PQQ-like beta-propeller repeat protein [Chloracidobacterium thermophilum]QUV80896.1 PQQ-like beta-propeller repeat protein [Chloracidobacterium sp. D]
MKRPAWRSTQVVVVVGLALALSQMLVAQQRLRWRPAPPLNGRVAIAPTTLPTDWLYLDPDSARQEPLVTENAVYVPLRTGKVVALARTDGARLWESAPGVATTAKLYRLGDALLACASSPAADGSPPGGIVRLLDLTTGVVRREVTLPAPITSQVVSDGLWLYVRLGTNEIAALNPQDFSRGWSVTGDFTEHLAYAAGAVFVGTSAGALWALDAKDGRRRWTCVLGATPGPAAAGEEMVYCGTSNGEVVAVRRADGRLRWRRRTGAAVMTPPLIRHGQVLVASYDNFLYAFHPQTGELRWQQQMAGRLASPPSWLTETTLAVAALDDSEITVVQVPDGRIVARWQLATERIFSVLHVEQGMVVMATERGIAAARLQ